jgi:hypothetical protein
MGSTIAMATNVKEVTMATAAQTWAVLSNNYAAQRNAVFSNTQSNLVDLVTRLNDTIAAMPRQAQRNWHAKLAKSLKIFKQNHPGLKNIADPKFRICKSLVGKLMHIMIDTTMQRQPNLQWILTIIENFRAYQVQPIQVYAVPGDKWGGWDGQHTSLALYLIATQGLGQAFEDVEVPINVYDILSRGELRSNFINMNTTTGKNAGKKPLDIIDIFQQKIYGVEVDGVTDPEWVAAHQKWKALADAGMFLTADKFNDTDQVGAISRLNEIDAASVDVVQKFAVYGKFIVNNQARPINTKEIPIIIEFLNLCEAQDIDYSDAVIENLADHCVDLFEANFDAKGPFWDQVHQANLNAYNKANQSLPKHMWPEAPRNSKNVPQGIAFFWHQLHKSWVSQQGKGFKFPKQPFSVFTPDTKDLF